MFLVTDLVSCFASYPVKTQFKKEHRAWFVCSPYILGKTMKKQFLMGALAASALAVGSFGQMSPAEALTFDGTTAIINTTNDLNQSFTVNFGGNVGGTDVSGLTSQAVITYRGTANTNNAIFDVLLSNTSTNGITSRTSALGFDINPNVTGGSVGDNPNDALPALFTDLVFGSNEQFPNQFGNIELCAINASGNNCTGGASGGVLTGNSGSFRFNLTLASASSPLVLTNFGVRYQSITGNGYNGASGTGRSIPVPTPALLPGLIGMGLAAMRKKKQEGVLQEA